MSYDLTKKSIVFGKTVLQNGIEPKTVRQVSPVADPANRTVTLGENECSGKIWYVFDN